MCEWELFESIIYLKLSFFERMKTFQIRSQKHIHLFFEYLNCWIEVKQKEKVFTHFHAHGFHQN